MDVNSLNKNGQLKLLGNRIKAMQRQFNEKVIIIAVSSGNMVALPLLKDSTV
jgi:hypothetical protein